MKKTTSEKKAEFKHPKPPAKDYKHELEKIEENIDDLRELISENAKKIKNSDVYKRWVNAKKALEISSQFIEVQGLFSMFEDSPEAKEKAKLQKDLKKLKKAYDYIFINNNRSQKIDDDEDSDSDS